MYTNPADRPWSEQDTLDLRRLFDTNASYRDIAFALHRTRNAVSGKVHRERLRATPEAKEMRRKTEEERRLGVVDGKKRRRPRARLEHGGSGQHFRFGYVKTPVPNPFKFVAKEAPVEPRHVTLLELEVGCCHWPYGVGSITFCGHPATNGSYCREHFNLSVQPFYRIE
jgi:hypothetical protein